MKAQQEPLMVLLVKAAKLNFILFLNDVPIYFYWHKDAASEQFIQLNGLLRGQSNTLEIQAFSGEFSPVEISKLNIQLGQVSGGRFQGRTIETTLLKVNAENKRVTIIQGFNAPNRPVRQVWETGDLINQSNIQILYDYYEVLKGLYAVGDVPKFIQHFEHAFKNKQRAFPSRPPHSFKGLLEYELNDEMTFEDRQVFDFQPNDTLKFFGHGKVAYTASQNWDATIASYQETDPDFLLGAYGLYICLIQGRPIIFWYE